MFREAILQRGQQHRKAAPSCLHPGRQSYDSSFLVFRLNLEIQFVWCGTILVSQIGAGVYANNLGHRPSQYYATKAAS